MAIQDWKKDESGIILHPIVGFETAVRPGAIGLRLLLGDRSGAAGTQVTFMQIGFSPEQARALAKIMMEGADRAEQSATTLLASSSLEPRN